MNRPATLPQSLDEATQRRFAGLILLDRVVTVPSAYHAGLLEEDDELLEPVFTYLQEEELVEIGADDYFSATEKGRGAFQNMLNQQQSNLVHYDVFAHVNLAEGTFADLDKDFLEDERWSDLRVAVAMYKGIDPYRMVFLAMLAEGKFFENPDWKFDLALGSSFFAEMEEIAASQLTVDDLAYVAEDGTRVSGEAVIEDIIPQGSALNQQRMERERARQQSLLDDEDSAPPPPNGGDGEVEWVMMPYDPYGSMAGYAASSLFVEALWLSAYW